MIKIFNKKQPNIFWVLSETQFNQVVKNTYLFFLKNHHNKNYFDKSLSKKPSSNNNHLGQEENKS